MTDRKDWKLGAASCILGGSDNFTHEGFSEYSNAGIYCCELSIWPKSMKKFDFIDHPEKLGNIIRGAGVEIYSVHLPYADGVSLSSPDIERTKSSLDIIKTTIRCAAKLGAKVVVMHPSWNYYDQWDDREELIRHGIERMKEVCEYANSFGLKCAAENMIIPGLCKSPEEMLRYLKEIPELGMCFDLNHSLVKTNEEFFNQLIEAGMHGRIYHIHVSDYDFVNERHWLPGKGVNDWDMIFSKLEELDYKGAFMYEVERTDATCYDIAKNYQEIMK